MWHVTLIFTDWHCSLTKRSFNAVEKNADTVCYISWLLQRSQFQEHSVENKYQTTSQHHQFLSGTHDLSHLGSLCHLWDWISIYFCFCLSESGKSYNFETLCWKKRTWIIFTLQVNISSHLNNKKTMIAFHCTLKPSKNFLSIKI